MIGAPARRSLASFVGVLCVLLNGTRVGAAQVRPDAELEARLLRDAAALEQQGDFQRAGDHLRLALEANPRSLTALVALERILAMTGRTVHLLPHIDTLLRIEPRSVIGHQMRVRAWAHLDQPDSLERAARTWIEAMPNVETPYREVARAWRTRADYARAIRVLEVGRDRIRRPDALALELGDAYADALQYDRAGAEWARAIGPHGEAFLLVQRRVVSLPNAGAAVIPVLVDRLARRPSTPARMKAAAQLAVDAGLEARATRISTRLVADLAGAERIAFLVELARRADGAGLDRLALWAYGGIVDSGPEGEAWLPLRARMAELALELGDTATAAAAFQAIEHALEHDAPARRQAAALRIELIAQEHDTDRASAELAAFRDAWGLVPEIDGPAAALANALTDGGRVAEAASVLTGLAGPRASLARARIRIHQGDFNRARNALLDAVPGLHGAEATDAIALATLLGRLSADGAALVGDALAGHAHADGLIGLLAGSETLPAAERAAILEYAADLADRRGFTTEAEQIRREIVDEFPRAPEAPTALLALARSLIARAAPNADVRLLLERMIVEYPRSALVPQARRELERLAGAGLRE